MARGISFLNYSSVPTEEWNGFKQSPGAIILFTVSECGVGELKPPPVLVGRGNPIASHLKLLSDDG